MYDHKEIYSLAKHYDIINDFNFDISFFKEYAKDSNGKILELGCGTGRITIPLAKSGFDILGLDVSQEMLLEAKHKALKSNIAIDFKKRDIINFNLNEKFELILCAHNTISHIKGVENLNSFFNSVKNHLTKKGIFILQVFNPDFDFFTRNPEEKFPLKKYYDPTTKELVELTESNFYDDESQINYRSWFFKIGEREFVKNWNQRVYYPQELDYIVQSMGFKIIDKFGDFDKNQFNENPKTQILVCQLN